MTELKTQLEQLAQQLNESDESRQQLMQQLQQEQQRCMDVQDQAQVSVKRLHAEDCWLYCSDD